MKVTVERAELLKSLGHVHRVVERRNTIPILANVLIKAEKGKISNRMPERVGTLVDAGLENVTCLALVFRKRQETA